MIDVPQLVPGSHYRGHDDVTPVGPRHIEASPKQNDADNHEEDVDPCTVASLTVCARGRWFRADGCVASPDGELISLVQCLQLIESSLSSMKPVARVVESLSESLARETLASFALLTLAWLSSEPDCVQVDFC